MKTLIRDNQKIDKMIYIDDDNNSYKGEKHHIAQYKNNMGGYKYYTFIDVKEDSPTRNKIVAIIAEKEGKTYKNKRPKDVPSDYNLEYEYVLQTNKRNGFRKKFKTRFLYSVNHINLKYSQMVCSMFLNLNNPHSENDLKQMNVSVMDSRTDEVLETGKYYDKELKTVMKPAKNLM